MKKNIFAVMAMATMVAFTSCNNATTNVDGGSASDSANTTGMKIAYVEVDSLMTQYKFCQEYAIELEKKSTNARNALNTKGQQLQKNLAKFQEKLQNNGFTSREEAERQQANLQRQDQDLQELQQRLAAELESETVKYNNALRDSLQSFLKAYNADKKYDIILSKAGDNILFANKQYDITADVINGLNKVYKSAFKETPKTK